MDIVEIAIDQFTDSSNFENLACEILYNEGFYDIKPMPGGNDFGQDAVEDKFYEKLDKTKRTIFQFSLQQYTKGKIKKTIARIKECKIDFEELIYVTKREVTGEVQEEIKGEIRKDFNVKVDIYERNTFINRLSHFENNIFNRHFPNIDKQIESLKNSKPTLSNDNVKSLETAILKSTLAFTLNNNIQKTRKSVFDNLILGLIYLNDKITLEELSIFYKDNFDNNFNNPQQIRSSTERLIKDDYILNHEGYYQITKNGRRIIESTNNSVNIRTEKLLEDIVISVKDLYKSPLSIQEVLRIKKNSKEIFIDIFKLFGIEIANKILDDALPNSFELENKEFLINKAKQNLPPCVADILISVIAEILRNPSIDQAKILSAWTKAYIGIKIIDLDPSLSEFSQLTFSKKKFFLDTDFLLNTIIKELPTSDLYSKLINKLISFGAKVYITKDVFDEALKHAAISSRTYHFFGKSLESLNDAIAESSIFNTFVRGYYYFLKFKSSNFQEYLSNYYDEELGEEFFKSVIYDSISTKVEIIDIESLGIKIPAELTKEFKQSMQLRNEQSKKAKYRNEEQTTKLIENDAQLFLTCYTINNSEKKANVVFGGNCYLITDSMKYLKTASEIKIQDSVTTKPLILEGIFELTGKSSLSDIDYVKLLDNSLLMSAIDGCLDEIIFIVKSGIKLNNKSLPRLKADFNEMIHQNISEFERIRNMPEEERLLVDDFEEKELKSFNDFINNMKHSGYSTIPEVDHFIQVVENKEKENILLKDELIRAQLDFSVLNEELQKFGKRRQHYLNKVKQKGKPKKK